MGKYTKEGLPVIEQETLETFIQEHQMDAVDTTSDYPEIIREQPVLHEYIEMMTHFLPDTPEKLKLYMSRVYSLLKRQSKANSLE